MVLALIVWSVFIVLAFFTILFSLEGEDIMGAPIVLGGAALAIAIPWGIYALAVGISNLL